jgi:hypothetical protein
MLIPSPRRPVDDTYSDPAFLKFSAELDYRAKELSAAFKYAEFARIRAASSPMYTRPLKPYLSVERISQDARCSDEPAVREFMTQRFLADFELSERTPQYR